MVRIVLYLFLFFIVVAVARGIISIVGKAFSQALKASGEEQPQMPVSGELRKDPVCGTYISTATPLKEVSGGTTFYFCSPECQKRFAAHS